MTHLPPIMLQRRKEKERRCPMEWQRLFILIMSAPSSWPDMQLATISLKKYDNKKTGELMIKFTCCAGNIDGIFLAFLLFNKIPDNTRYFSRFVHI